MWRVFGTVEAGTLLGVNLDVVGKNTRANRKREKHRKNNGDG